MSTPSAENAPTPEQNVQSLLDVLNLTDLGQVELSAQGLDGDTAGDVVLGQHHADLFEGQSQPQPHGRVFGGQVLAQCVMAAGRTVPEVNPGKPRHIHSLHGYFLRPGDSSKPIRFAVERMRDGGSFSARRVHAIQHGAPIMSMIMSFQEESGGIEHQATMPDAPEPETLPTTADVVGDLDHPIAKYWAYGRSIDIRHVEPALYVEPDSQPRDHQRLWLRAPLRLPDDELLHAAVLAYASDFTMLESAMRATGVAWATPGYRAASLDHAMWFHRRARMDEWVLFSQEAPSASGGRGLGVGKMFAKDGTLVATVAQEGMMRLKPPQ